MDNAQRERAIRNMKKIIKQLELKADKLRIKVNQLEAKQ
jgi:hypothetical protein